MIYTCVRCVTVRSSRCDMNGENSNHPHIEIVISSRTYLMMVRYCDEYCIYTMYTRRIDDIYVCDAGE